MLKSKKKPKSKLIKKEKQTDKPKSPLMKPKVVKFKSEEPKLSKPKASKKTATVDYSLWKKHLRATYFEGEGGKRTKGYVVSNKADLRVLVNMLMSDDLIYFDTEFTNLMVQSKGKSDTVGMSFSRTSKSDDDHYYIPFLHLEDDSEQIGMRDAVPILRPLWEDETKTFVGHNIN